MKRLLRLGWQVPPRGELLDWLLAGEPWVVHRTLVDLLDVSENDKPVIAARMETAQHPSIRSIFKNLNRDGYWGKPKDIHTWWPRKYSTFWMLPMLGDFGFTVADKRIARACEYVFSTQLPSGAFGWDPPTKPGDCHSAIIIESLAKAGLLGDPRLVKAYEWLMKRQRLDGGFWCKDTGCIGRPREKEPSCAMATMFTLGALAENPELQSTEVARRTVDFLFGCWENRRRMKYAGHDSQIGTGWEKLKYPFTDYKILKFLDALSRFEYARRRLQESEILEILLSKADRQGRFTPESIHEAWADFDFGQKKAPSKWITFLALRVMQRIHEQGLRG